MPAVALKRSDLPSETIELARFLLGKTLVHHSNEGETSGRILETEAYIPGDQASHAYRGKTARNRAMFLERGHAYIYLIYGIWHCMNVSSEKEGIGAGVLVRAMRPLCGVDLMLRRCGVSKPVQLMTGPGLLCRAMGINLDHNSIDLCAGHRLWLAPGNEPAKLAAPTTRVGLTKNADALLRFRLEE